MASQGQGVVLGERRSHYGFRPARPSPGRTRAGERSCQALPARTPETNERRRFCVGCWGEMKEDDKAALVRRLGSTHTAKQIAAIVGSNDDAVRGFAKTRGMSLLKEADQRRARLVPRATFQGEPSGHQLR